MKCNFPAGTVDIAKLASAIYRDEQLARQDDTIRFLTQLLAAAWERRDLPMPDPGMYPVPRVIFGERPTPKLGLDALTDDQALDLCAAIYEEIGCRFQGRWWLWLDHKQRIEDDYKARQDTWLGAIGMVRDKQAAAFRKQIAAELEAKIDQGGIQLVDEQDRANILGDATDEIQIRVIDRFCRELESGSSPQFTLEVLNGIATLKLADGTKAERILAPGAANALADSLKKWLG